MQWLLQHCSYAPVNVLCLAKSQVRGRSRKFARELAPQSPELAALAS